MADQTDRKFNIDWKLILSFVGVLVAIFVVFYGNNLCSQVNPPQWIIPILNKVCPASIPTPGNSSIPEQKQSNDLFVDHFDQFEGDISNSMNWGCNNCQAGKAFVQNQVLQLEVNGKDQGLNVRSKYSWKEPEYISAKFSLVQTENNGNGSVEIGLNTTLQDSFWETHCGITPDRFSKQQASFYCEVAIAKGPNQWNYEYSTQPVKVGFNEWHTMEIEISANDFRLSFYLDNNLIAEHTPVASEELLNQNLNAQIGIYAEGVDAHVLSYIDDVTIQGRR